MLDVLFGLIIGIFIGGFFGVSFMALFNYEQSKNNCPPEGQKGMGTQKKR